MGTRPLYSEDATVNELAVEQSFTLYHPDGRHPQSTGEQRVWLKLPGRQRATRH